MVSATETIGREIIVSYLTYQLGLSRIDELHRQAVAQRLANTACSALPGSRSDALAKQRAGSRLAPRASGRMRRIRGARRPMSVRPRGALARSEP
jgi:hypothetical protein